MANPTYDLNDLDLLKQARRSWRNGETELALEQFERATRSSPRNARALVERATALGKRYRMREACELLKAARSIAGDDPLAATRIARSYAQLYRLPEAIETLEAVPVESQIPSGFANLAIYYEQVGRFACAEEAIRRCLDEVPQQPEPQLILARILTHRAELTQSRRLLLELLKRRELQRPLLTVRALYQLGIVLDRAGDFRAALKAVTDAKAIQKKFPGAEQLARTATARNEQLASIYKRLDVDTIDRWADEDLPPLPGGMLPAHLVGFPRSGTTLLEQPLDAHRDLVASSERLVFADEILPALVGRPDADTEFDSVDGATWDELCGLRERYIECMRATHRDDFVGKVHLDKKPANLAFLFGLFRLLPESRFVIAIRDPRDVIVSCFMRYFPLTDMSACFLSWGTTCMLYSQMMDIWLYMREVLPPNSWLEVRYEEVCDDIVGQSSRVFGLVELRPDPKVASYLDGTQNKYVHSPTFAEVRTPVHQGSVGRWENYAKHLQPFLSPLSPWMEALGYA